MEPEKMVSELRAALGMGELQDVPREDEWKVLLGYAMACKLAFDRSTRTRSQSESTPGFDGGMGARLRQLREERGWSRTYLANKAHVGYDTLDNIEDGLYRRRPQKRTIRALADSLEVSVGFLMAGE